jgi:NADP-dependent 3-hydroxy acid dehydrogenase YdfG
LEVHVYLERIPNFLDRLLEAAKADGVADIVIVTSTAARVAYQGGGGYNAAKAAESALAQALRFLVRQLRPRERVQFELLTRYIGKIF